MWKKIVQISQKVLGKELKNPHELDKELLNAFSAFIQPLEAIDEGLALSLLRYLIDDDDEACLLKLAGNNAAIEKLMGKNNGYHYHDTKEGIRRATVVDGTHKAPPEVWYRYGKLLEAISKPPYIYSQHTNYVKLPDWLTLLVTEISTRYSANLRATNKKLPWSADNLENVLLAGGLPADSLVSPFLDTGYSYVWRGNSYSHDESFLKFLQGVNNYMARHVETVRQHLLRSNADERISAMEKLHAIDFDCTLISDLLVQFGTGSSKTVREAILPLFRANPKAFRSQIEAVLKDGAASERNEAVILLCRVFESDFADTLKAHLEIEKAERVKQTIGKYLATPTEADDAVIEIAPLQVEIDPVKLPDDVKKVLRECIDEGHRDANRNYEQQLAVWNGPNKPVYMQKPVKPEALSAEEFDDLIAFVEGTNRTFEFPNKLARWVHAIPKKINDCLAPPDVKLAHVVRLMYALRYLQIQTYRPQSQRVWMSNPPMLENYRTKSNNSFGLREFDAVVSTLPDYCSGLVAMSYLGGSAWYKFCDWEPEAVWPLFAERGDLLKTCLSPDNIGNEWSNGNRETAFQVLAMFPVLPGQFIPTLWELALGEGKTERRPAQNALNSVPGKVERIILSLSDGKQGTRTAAAEWLGRLGDSSAIEPLKKAFQKEKNEQAKGIIVHALDLLNADVDEFLNRDKLLVEAKAGLAKKMPKGMEWMPLDNLPTVHWKDNGNKVDPEIVKWWIVQSVQQKTPVCGPILKRYLEMCQPADAVKLAKYALTTWIGRDTTTISHEDAVERANEEADKQWNAYSKQQWWLDAYKNKDNVFKMHYNSLMSTCLYSAIDQKGMLAIVSAAGDADCVKLCEQYIRKWYGNRTAQCKALVDVLSWISHPLALQALLAIANRFRTKSIKELAAEHVKAVAERRGWTIDELADRTIPDGGFEIPVDEDGKPLSDKAVLEIDFGPRQFVVTLNDQLETVICAKGETKPLKALPAPAKSDDEELAKAGKKEFTDAKKVAKEVVKRQSERLYEALCTQRAWRFEDWQLYLSKHPIVGRLCVRLAWVVFEPGENGEPGKFLGAFRPLEDGSLTNEQDEQVSFPNDSIVKLAHSCNMPAELGDAWVKHFEDYDVTPLFAQFGRPVYIVPEDKSKATDINDFVGYLITTFKLRNRAVKLGYVRGEAEDGGCFYVYKKPFTSLEMQAVLEFTGSYLPEEDVAAALKELYFVALKDSTYSWSSNKIPLSKVPQVLLSECYNDVKQIAADGSGFDPKWQEKSYF